MRNAQRAGNCAHPELPPRLGWPVPALHLQLSADEKFPAYMDLTLQLAATQGLIPAVRGTGGKSLLSSECA
jgi:hypothetical protein